MQAIELIGHFAAICTTASFLPQAIKVMRTKDTESLSLSMYVLFTLGIIGWLTYGFLIHNMPLIIANHVTLVLASIILFMKVRDTLKARKQ